MKKYTFLVAVMFALIIGIASIGNTSIFRSNNRQSNGIVTSAKAGLNIGGDLRYRYEDMKDDNEEARNQVRARIRLNAYLDNGFTFGLQLNSYDYTLGTDDPENITLDRAYFGYQNGGLRVKGGRMPNPFYTPGNSELLWDNDYNPEGLTAGYYVNFNNLRLTATVAQIQDNDFTGEDQDTYGGQITAITEVLNMDIKLGTGYYSVEDTDVEYRQYFAEIKSFFILPVTVYGDYSKSNGREGYTLGSITELSDALSVDYAYTDIETESVMESTDTDIYDHKFGVNYALASNVIGNVTLFTNEEIDLNRYQVNLILEF